MSHWSRFAGLAAPDVGDSTTELNSEFVYRNPDLIDQFLRIGAKSHRHNDRPALPNPTHAPTIGSSVATGSLSPGTEYFVTFTVVDSVGGETMAAPGASATTGGSIPPPSAVSSAGVSFASGIMPAGDYAYAFTLTDGQGGETTLGPTLWITIDPGHASAEVNFVGLSSLLAGGATQWRMWRSYEGADWHLVTQASTNTFTDGGFDPPDNPARPPASNTTGTSARSFTVTLPASAVDPALASGSQINVYLSTSSDFWSPALFTSLPIACAGATFTVTNSSVSAGEPPHQNLSIGGAARIFGPNEVIGWQTLIASASGIASGGSALPGSANAQGELIFQGANGTIVTVQSMGGGSALVTINASGSAGPQGPPGVAGSQGPPGTGGGGSAVAVGQSATPAVNPVSYIEFVGSGGTGVAVTSLGGGSALVTISASASGGVGGGLSVGSATTFASGSAATITPVTGLVVIGAAGNGENNPDGYMARQGGVAIVQLDPLPALYEDGFDSAGVLTSGNGSPLQISNGSLSISGSQLSGGGGDARVLVNLAFLGRKPMRDGVVQAKIIPGAVPDIALTFGNHNQWAQLNGGLLSLKSFIGGSNTLASPGYSPVAGTPIWVRFASHAGVLLVEVWSKDPATRVPGDAPVLAQSVSTASVRQAYGWPGLRFNNTTDVVDDLKVWSYPEAVD